MAYRCYDPEGCARLDCLDCNPPEPGPGDMPDDADASVAPSFTLDETREYLSGEELLDLEYENELRLERQLGWRDR